MFYLTTHSTHFIYGYMALDIWLRTILIYKEKGRVSRCLRFCQGKAGRPTHHTGRNAYALTALPSPRRPIRTGGKDEVVEDEWMRWRLKRYPWCVKIVKRIVQVNERDSRSAEVREGDVAVTTLL